MVRQGALLLLLALLVGCEASEPDQQQLLLYSVGYELGAQLRQQGVTGFDHEALVSGVQAGLRGSSSYDPAKLDAAVLQWQALQQQQLQIAIEKNGEAGRRFAERFASKKAVQQTPSGLLYRVLNTGEGKAPRLNDQLLVRYQGSLVDGTVFDQVDKSESPLAVRLDEVIPGWSEALRYMREGSRWELVVPAALAYGNSRQDPRIPPGSTLVFNLELVAIADR